MFTLSLSAYSKFTQEGHHRTPVRESRLNQIQADKSREKVPVRVYVVPKCQGQQNEAAGNQTKCTFYRHSSSPSKQARPTQCRIAEFRTQRHFLGNVGASVEAGFPFERGSKERAPRSATGRSTRLLPP